MQLSAWFEAAEMQSLGPGSEAVRETGMPIAEARCEAVIILSIFDVKPYQCYSVVTGEMLGSSACKWHWSGEAGVSAMSAYCTSASDSA